MPIEINVADILEDNDKSIRQNNMEKTHNIPLRTLVEVDMETWHGDGACEVTRARLWVVSHDRDCDGTPLYSLSRVPRDKWAKDMHMVMTVPEDGTWELKEDITQGVYYKVHTGFSEESLKVIPVTEDLKSGKGSLNKSQLVPYINHAPLASVAAIYYHMHRLEGMLDTPESKAIASAIIDECTHCSPTLKELIW